MTPACQHPNARPCLRTLSNKTTAIYAQCPECGAVASNAMRKDAFTPEQLAALPAFDEQLKDSGWKEERERAVALSEQQLAEQRARYAQYLLTPAWRAKREQVLMRDHFQCQGCRAATATQVHHLTYDHICDELLFELVSLCKSCHERCHHLP